MKRYQECRWPVRLWRRRWYLAIPFWAVTIWWTSGGPQGEPLWVAWSFRTCWSVARGLAQAKMEWWHTHEEVFGDLTRDP